jgi:hypothetical protein
LKHTFVTIAHAGDFGMLHLQARSMDVYLTRDQVEEIIVVKNLVPPPEFEGPDINRAMYGTLKDLVRIIDGPQLIDIPSTGGWFSQQILKLAVCGQVASSSYLLLDAKNHFIFPLADNFLYVGNKIRTYWTDYRTHPLKQYLDNTLAYFQLQPREKFLPPVTPFLMRADFAKRLITRVEQRENKPFAQAFLDLRITEFFALNAFILSCGYEIEDIYNLSGKQCHVIWKDTLARYPNALKEDIASAERDRRPLFSIHRKAMEELSAKSRGVVASFWKKRNLFRRISDGVEYLRAPNSFDWLS